MKAPQRQSAPGADSSTDVHIKSSRGPHVDIRLSALPLNTSILELKQKVAMEAGLGGTDKIRLLYSKKPCSDSKSIKDVLGGESSTAAEFTAMFIGVTPSTSTQADTSTAAKATQSSEDSGQALLETEEFWTGLEGYLRQQLNGTAVAQSTTKLFRDAWKEKGKSL
jgi:ubiquitin-like protein 4